jgi:hypothetical protein
LPGSYVLKSNSTGAQNVILQIKIRWRKVKHAGLAQKNDYDITAAPCFWLANHFGLLLVVSPYISSPVLIL